MSKVCGQAESQALEDERQKQKLALQAAYEAHVKQIKQDRTLVDAAAAKLVEQRHGQAEAMRKQEAELEARVAQERAAEEARRREIILQLRWDFCTSEIRVTYDQALSMPFKAQGCAAFEVFLLDTSTSS